MTKWRASTC